MSTLNPYASAFIPIAYASHPVTVTGPVSATVEELLEEMRAGVIEEMSLTPLEIALKPLEKPNKNALRYPFSFIGEEDLGYDYETKHFCKGLLNEEPFDIGNFPKNISEYYWIHEGENDEEAWRLFCKIKLPTGEDAYAHYTASCDCTGFNCQGGMNMTVSKSAEALFNSLTEAIRMLFIKEKTMGKQEKRKCIDECDDYLEAWPKAPEVEKSGKNAVNPKSAFIRIWHNDEELKLTLDSVNGLEMEELEYAICGLTAKFLTPKVTTTSVTTTNATKSVLQKPKKKFYTVNICCGTNVTDIDDVFIRRFNNPDKKWLLRMQPHRGDDFIRKWGKVEVSFTLY